MKYHIYNKTMPKDVNRSYTIKTIELLLINSGHKILEVDEAEIILFSIRDVTEVADLKRLRDKYPDRKIIVGGHFSVFYKLLVLFADYVYLGEIFKFLKYNSLDEIEKSEHIVTAAKVKRKESFVKANLIEWDKYPIARLSKRTHYYMHSVGCKNYCGYCLTSYVNPYQENSQRNIYRAAKQVGTGSLTLVGNEISESQLKNQKVKDMTVLEYLQKPCSKIKIRVGGEFCLQETRDKYTKKKSFTMNQLKQAILKAKRESVTLHIFLISGIESRKDWENFFNEVSMECFDHLPRIVYKFTNFEPQMFTPMFKMRHTLKLENYLDAEFTEKIFHKYAAFSCRNRIMAVKYPAHAIWRMGMSGVINKKQYELMDGLRKEKDLYMVYDSIKEAGILDTDYSKTIKMVG